MSNATLQRTFDDLIRFEKYKEAVDFRSTFRQLAITPEQHNIMWQKYPAYRTSGMRPNSGPPPPPVVTQVRPPPMAFQADSTAARPKFTAVLLFFSLGDSRYPESSLAE